MNYAGHAAEAGVPLPDFPSTFTKFPPSITSPNATVSLPSPHVDWEVELVVVIGRPARHVFALNGEVLQRARTSELIFPVSTLVSELSSVLPLLPGDLIFTGTPVGIGATRTPRYLRPGDELRSTIEGLGTMRTLFVERSLTDTGVATTTAPS